MLIDQEAIVRRSAIDAMANLVVEVNFLIYPHFIEFEWHAIEHLLKLEIYYLGIKRKPSSTRNLRSSCHGIRLRLGGQT